MADSSGAFEATYNRPKYTGRARASAAARLNGRR